MNETSLTSSELQCFHQVWRMASLLSRLKGAVDTITTRRTRDLFFPKSRMWLIGSPTLTLRVGQTSSPWISLSFMRYGRMSGWSGISGSIGCLKFTSNMITPVNMRRIWTSLCLLLYMAGLTVTCREEVFSALCVLLLKRKSNDTWFNICTYLLSKKCCDWGSWVGAVMKALASYQYVPFWVCLHWSLLAPSGVSWLFPILKNQYFQSNSIWNASTRFYESLKIPGATRGKQIWITIYGLKTNVAQFIMPCWLLKEAIQCCRTEQSHASSYLIKS